MSNSLRLDGRQIFQTFGRDRLRWWRPGRGAIATLRSAKRIHEDTVMSTSAGRQGRTDGAETARGGPAPRADRRAGSRSTKFYRNEVPTSTAVGRRDRFPPALDATSMEAGPAGRRTTR